MSRFVWKWLIRRLPLKFWQWVTTWIWEEAPEWKLELILNRVFKPKEGDTILRCHCGGLLYMKDEQMLRDHVGHRMSPAQEASPLELLRLLRADGPPASQRLYE